MKQHDKLGLRIANEVRKLISGYELTEGQKLASVTSVISNLVEGLTKEALNARPPDAEKLSEEELFKFCNHNFSVAKRMVSTSVAEGMTHAVHSFSKMDVDYHCWIEMVDPAIGNKIPC